jgi:hypothetical protein
MGCTFQLISSVTSDLCIGGLLVLEGFSDILDQKHALNLCSNDKMPHSSDVLAIQLTQ